jgi:predicted dithiol-disulfide oxidoreductase (DUF899 family)
MMQQRLATRDEWIAARKELLIKEKALTRAHDELAAERRRLPMVKVDKTYVFETAGGRRTLADLFDGRSQLVVYHFMMAPDWSEGCASCSLLADHLDGSIAHLAHRDVTLAVVARAPLANIEAFKRRMGWTFTWVSSFGSDFNYDYRVSFTDEQIAAGEVDYNYGATPYAEADLPGTSVFAKDAAGQVFHTYSSYARGGDLLLGAFNWLDLTPKGRNESGIMSWVRLHDEYDTNGADADACRHSGASAAPSLR